MTGIDLSTNLPELPKGLYWRVGWYDYLHRRHQDEYPRNSLAIPRVTVCVFETVQKKFLWHSYTREVCLSHYPVLKPRVPYPTPGSTGFAGIDGKFVESVADLTVEQIRAGAKYVIANDDYLAERQRLREQRSSLLGNYPPKKLPEETR